MEVKSHRRSAEFTAGQSGRFERDFVELAEVGSGEFGKVIKVRCKGDDDDSEIFAVKKSKQFEGLKHRQVITFNSPIPYFQWEAYAQRLLTLICPVIQI